VSRAGSRTVRFAKIVDKCKIFDGVPPIRNDYNLSLRPPNSISPIAFNTRDKKPPKNYRLRATSTPADRWRVFHGVLTRSNRRSIPNVYDSLRQRKYVIPRDGTANNVHGLLLFISRPARVYQRYRGRFPTVRPKRVVNEPAVSSDLLNDVRTR